MIDNKFKHTERSKQSHLIQKPEKWYPYGGDAGNPEQIGLHQNQRKHHIKKKK